MSISMTVRLGVMLLVAPPAFATIAIPTDFPTMVAKADLVFAGNVIAKHCEWVTRDEKKIIVTVVSFQPAEVYKGPTTSKIELTSPGGTLDGKKFEVVGIPQFEIGETCVVFARTNSKAFSPVVGLYHGKLSIKDDPANGQKILFRRDRKPVADLNDIGHDANDDALTGNAIAARAALPPMTLQQFKEHVQSEVRSPSKRR